MNKKLLVVVDMQNDFIDGSLGTDEAKAIVQPVCQRIREWDGDVFMTEDTHGDSYLDTSEGRMLPVKHCIVGTPGHRIHDDVMDAYHAKEDGLHAIFHKPTFGSTEMMHRMMQVGYEQVVFVGLCTDICVLSNAIMAKAALPNAQIFVDASCCAGTSPASHQRALEVMSVCHILH